MPPAWISLDKNGRFAERLLGNAGNLGIFRGKTDGKQQERLLVSGASEDLA